MARARKNGDCVSIGSLAIGGKDLIAIGIKGVAIGKTLSALLDLVLHKPGANERERLLSEAKRIATKGIDGSSAGGLNAQRTVTKSNRK